MKTEQVDSKEALEDLATDCGRKVGQIIVAALEAQTGFRQFVRDALVTIRAEDRDTWFVDEVLGTIECYCGLEEGTLDVDAQSLYVDELREAQAEYERAVFSEILSTTEGSGFVDASRLDREKISYLQNSAEVYKKAANLLHENIDRQIKSLLTTLKQVDVMNRVQQQLQLQAQDVTKEECDDPDCILHREH